MNSKTFIRRATFIKGQKNDKNIFRQFSDTIFVFSNSILTYLKQSLVFFYTKKRDCKKR